MVGIIISGHGKFATGLQAALNLISGEIPNAEYVDFEKQDSTETLKEKYYNALKKLDNCDKILAFADLVGGSPFKTLVEVKSENTTSMEVVGGVNLPMLLEIGISKDINDDLNSLAKQAIDIGKCGILKYNFAIHEDIEEEDGI